MKKLILFLLLLLPAAMADAQVKFGYLSYSEAIKAMPGVKNASVSFMAQKLLLEADDDKFDAVLKDAVKTAKKVEPDFEIEL